MMRLCALWLVALLLCGAGENESSDHRPVRAVSPQGIPLGSDGILPLYLSASWAGPLPDITRAVLVLHGYRRNADSYFRIGLQARDAAGAAGASTLILAPQFLADIDIAPNHQPPDVLRWRGDSWEGGEPSLGPGQVSAFAALDAIVARLADRRLFPNLANVVIAGHSGGAQVVQRYAIAAHPATWPFTLRYVVANPSSYAWFIPDRPQPAIAAACPGYDDWKYGMQHRPAYLAQPSPAALEQAYVGRRVVYLLGTLDTDPHHPALDTSCMGEAQGPTRYARGHSYIAAMQARDGGTPNHGEWDVPGAGHDAARMFLSPCGLRALFDAPGCGPP